MVLIVGGIKGKLSAIQNERPLASPTVVSCLRPCHFERFFWIVSLTADHRLERTSHCLSSNKASGTLINVVL